MELLSLLRALWRHRILGGLGVVAAIGVGLLIANGGASRSGVAEAHVVLDTPRSQLVDAVAIGSDTLGWRASLLADLMSSRPVRTRIAHDLHISEDSLVVVAPYLSVPAKPTALSKLGVDAAAATPEPYVLRVSRSGGVPFDAPLPFISIRASAPDRTKAIRLTNAARAALIAAASTPESTPDIHRNEIQQVVVDSVGPARAREVVSGSRALVGLLVAVVLSGLWCCAIALVSGVVRGRRIAGRVQPAG